MSTPTSHAKSASDKLANERSYEVPFSDNVHDISLNKGAKAESAILSQLSHQYHSIDGPSGSSRHSKLCCRCKAIDFRAIFAMSLNQVGWNGLVVTEHRMDFDSTCSLCQYIAVIDPTTMQNGGKIAPDGYHLRAFSSLRFADVTPASFDLELTPNIALAIIRGPVFAKYAVINTGDLFEHISKGLISMISPFQTCQFSEGGDIIDGKRKVHSSRANFPFLASYIQDYKLQTEQSHGACIKRSQSMYLNTNVIDCYSRDIVQLKEDQEYLTLSYVWGTTPAIQNLDACSTATTSVLPSPAPATIENAIQVVINVGKRYLWVDKYCVKRDADKHLQIENMGLVYEGALATIVAVAAEDSESGLPGVSSIRCIRPYVELEQGTLMSTLRPLSHHLSVSKWATRGWTYQEAFLSKRCLFFTQEQVFFACRGSIKSEASSQYFLPRVRSLGRIGQNLMTLIPQMRDKDLRRIRPSFEDHVSEYTSRSLSFDSDGLNAFKGMLTRLPYISYWGIPLSLKSQRWISAHTETFSHFLTGLAWRCLGPGRDRLAVKRRKGFPTWSWASIAGQIECQNSSDFRGNNCLGTLVFAEKTDGTKESIAYLCKTKKGESHVIPELSRYLHICGYVTKFDLIHSPKDEILWRVCRVDELDDSIHPALIHFDIYSNEVQAIRRGTTMWHALLLSSGPWSNWLLLNWENSTAYRVGIIRYPGGANIPTEKRTIRLG